MSLTVRAEPYTRWAQAGVYANVYTCVIPSEGMKHGHGYETPRQMNHHGTVECTSVVVGNHLKRSPQAITTQTIFAWRCVDYEC